MSLPCFSVSEYTRPHPGVTPQDILNGAGWRELLENFEPNGSGEVTWKAPKLDYDEMMSLEDAARTLGIQDVFSPAADFTPLTDMELFVSAICQQSAVTMAENGIEAASFTWIAAPTAGGPPEAFADRADMILNRPFIYIIYAEGLPLFVGVVNML